MARRGLLAALVLSLCASAAVQSSAQTLPLVFTAPVPVPDSTNVDVRASPAIADRALAMWAGASDFGVGVDVATPRWAVRSIQSLNVIPVAGRPRPTFQQIEVARPLFVSASTTVAAGGGLREEWDGTRVLLGRAVAARAVAGGQLQGSFVMERAFSSHVRRDSADVVTSAGWSRRVGPRLAVGVEGIGQDLEGFWDAAEADGGAKLLVGPSLHLRSRSGEWSASVTAGPVFLSVSTMSSVDGVAPRAGGGHLGAFAAASWTPAHTRD